MARMASDATVEWGGDKPVRWLDRLLGDPETGRDPLSAPALGGAVVASALMLAAELAPWASRVGADGPGLYVGQAGGFLLVAYYPGWMVLLAMIGAALVVRPRGRRIVVAAGLGWVAGLLVVIAGIARQATTGGAFVEPAQLQTAPGPGMFFGFAAVLVAAVALVLTGWRPGAGARRRLRLDREPDVDPGPPDLTVTPVG
jgi:hypothetical protein